MNSIERVTAVINHKTPDRIPVYPIVSGVSRFLNNSTYYEWANNANICCEALIKAQELLQTDVICTLTDLSVEASDFGQELIFPENEAAHPNFNNLFIKSIDDYHLIKEIDPHKTPRMSEHIKLCQLLVEKKGDNVPIVPFIFGPLGILSMLRGQENLFMDLYDDPESVKKALNTITNVLIKYCDALLATGACGIMIDTLFASQSIMSKEMWLEFEGPYVQKISQYIHHRNRYVMIHNCGNGIYFDVQIEMMAPEVISFLHLPDDCNSLQELKSKYGNQTTLMGMISPTWLINANADEIIEECNRQIKILSDNGGFILATGCEYPANMSLEKAKIICSTVKN